MVLCLVTLTNMSVVMTLSDPYPICNVAFHCTR